MPYNGSGSFSSLGPPDFPAISGATISSTYYNNELNDIFTGLSTALCRDGQSTVSGHFNWNAKNLTNVGTFGATAGTFSSTLAVTGAATFSSTLVTTGAVTSGGALTVSSGGAAITGNSSFANNLTVGGTLGTTGAATFSSTLAVTGTSTFTGNTTSLGTSFFGDTGFAALLSSSNPTVQWDANDFVRYDRVANTLSHVIGGITQLTVDSAATSVAGALTITGAISAGSSVTAVGPVQSTGAAGEFRFYDRTIGAARAFSWYADSNLARLFSAQSATDVMTVSSAGAVACGAIAATGVTVGGNAVWHAGNLTPSNYALLASPALTGTPTAPTAADATNTTQLATTAFVHTRVSTALGSYATLASPTLTGTPTAPTAAAATNTTQIATTAFVTTADNLKANLASPTFTGTITMPASMTFTANGSNPRITFASGDWLEYDVAANKLYLAIGSTNVASIDSSGNLKVLGTITASTTP